MTQEQKVLLLEIIKWRNTDFHNEMEDHWTSDNFRISSECHKMIRTLEAEYKDKYGELPHWKYITDMWDFAKTLKGDANG